MNGSDKRHTRQMGAATRNSHCRVLHVACCFPHGFTLIELILVALIIVVLASASIPRLSGTALRLRAEQAAFEMAQLLRLAHAQAVSEGRDATWTWDETARRVRVEPSGTVSSPLPGAMSVGVSRSGEPVECRCVRFFPGGTSEAAAITIGPYTITVDAATSRVLLR